MAAPLTQTVPTASLPSGQPVPAEAPASPVQIDPTLVNFLLSERYRASQETIKKEFSLTDEEMLLIGDLGRLVMAGSLNLEGFLLALEDDLARLPEADRDRLYAKLLA